VNKKLIYIAHPVSPVEGETYEENLKGATEWLRWAILTKGVYAIAPYIGMCYALDEEDPMHRTMGIDIDLEVIGRCDQLWLCGPRVSSGMAVEASYAGSCGIDTRDFTGREDPL